MTNPTNGSGQVDSTRRPVRVGQVWADNDPRAIGRTLLVEAVGDTHATCVVLTSRKHRPAHLSVGKVARVALKRFRPTNSGYRLIQDVAE